MMVRHNKKLKENIAGYLFILPAVALFGLVGAYSVVMSIIMSLYQWVNKISDSVFVGLQNYRWLLFEGAPVLKKLFYEAIFNNIKIVFFSLLLIIPIAFIIALVVNEAKKGKGLFRTIYLVPMVASGTAIYLMWRGLFLPDGALNNILGAVGLSFLKVPQGWLGDIDQAFSAVMGTIVWSGVPSVLILYYAGLNTVSSELYESAELDGASWFQKLLFITWPLLKPITIVAVINLINGTFQMFENVFMLTRGGPAGATQILGTMIYFTAFNFQIGTDVGGYGMASAMGWLGFMVTMIFSIISMRLLKTGDKTER